VSGPITAPVGFVDVPADADARPSARGVARARRTRWWRPVLWLPTVVSLGLAAVLWNVVAAGNPYLLPPLGFVGEELSTRTAFYLDNALSTLGIALAGLLIGFVVALVVGILVSELPVVRRAIMPLVVVLNVTPVIALAPALVVAFGFGPLPKLIVTALITLFPILMNVTVGLRSVSPQVLQVFRTIRASRLEVLLHLRLPSALPYLFAAFRVVFPLSVVGAVVAEFSAPGAAKGLGSVISIASSNSQLAVVYAAIACLAVLGTVLLLVVTTIERRVLSWHESQLSVVR
jgi:NitT/TauT family transport system permease protein